MEALMRRALNVVLVVAGILTTVMASPSKEVAINGDFRNFVRVDGLHVALPTDMTSFPAMLVAQP